MENLELVKMSEKGQLVVPQSIRQIGNLRPGERFIALPVEEGVLFKRVEIPKVKLKFDALAKEIEEQFKKQKVKESDVDEAINLARA